VTSYSLFGVNGNGATGPSTVASYSGAFECAHLFMVTSYCWVTGYQIWIPGNGDTSATYTFCLYQLTDTGINSSGVILVPGSKVTMSGGTAGTWASVSLPTPLELPPNVSNSTPGPAYAVCCGWTAVNGFPDSDNQWGSGDPYASGITEGPLFAFSDQGASAPEPFTSDFHQGLFSTASADPSTSFPGTANVSTNFWVDLTVSTTPPAGASHRIWPNLPWATNYVNDTASNFTLGVEIDLTQAVTVGKLWFYSPQGVTQMPTEAGIYSVSTQTLVAGSTITSPSWSGAAGSGWVSVSYSSLSLAAGKYKPVVLNGAGSPAVWSGTTASYWTTGGPGASNLVNGPVTAYSNANADSPGQSTYNAGSAITYPATNVGPYNYWVDLEVTPLPSPAGAGGLLVPGYLAATGTV
jgi:hypothetical protein